MKISKVEEDQAVVILEAGCISQWLKSHSAGPKKTKLKPILIRASWLCTEEVKSSLVTD